MSVPRYWRESKYRYRLIGQICASCGCIEFPRSGICGACGSGNLKEAKLAETGHIVSWTVEESSSLTVWSLPATSR